MTLAELGERRDARGPYAVTACRVTRRRFAGPARGIEADELALAAARRPGEAAYYIRGRYSGGEFRFRRGNSWRITVEDEFGNVLKNAGDGDPDFLTFRGTPLPVSVAVRPGVGSLMTSVEVTTGRVSRYLGRGDGRAWAGRAEEGYVRVAFDEDGAVEKYATAAGATLAPAGGAPSPLAVCHERPRYVVLPEVIYGAAAAVPRRVPLVAELSRSPGITAPERPGQMFDGTISGNVISGEFILDPSAQTPLAPAAGYAPAAVDGFWPRIQNEGELERLAASYRAEHKSVRFVTGLGLFCGNLLAEYEWLDVDGDPVAAPARPVPDARIALAAGERRVGLKYFAVGEIEPVGRGARRKAGATFGLRDEAELVYRAHVSGASAGEILVRYECPADEAPALYLFGEVFGQRLEAAAFGEPAGPEGFRTWGGRPAAFATYVAAGKVVAVPDEDAKPPAGFVIGTADGGLTRFRWRRMATALAGREIRTCRVYDVEPYALRAYYTYDGVLARLEGRDFRLSLEAYPARRPRRAAGAPAAETPPAETPPPAEAAGGGNA
ncbi:MAG: hypothetical protein PVH29_02525 [Candidatus Zixiibacteriota bacterium]